MPAFAAWTAPVGIPAPPFGINEGQPSGGPVSASVPSGTITGPATYRLSGNISSLRFTARGSAAGYVYVTSADPNNPATIGSIEASGSYVIFDHLKIGPNGGFGVGEGSDHVVLRNSEVVGTLSGGGVWIGTWSYSGSQKASSIVLDHNNVHDIGDVNATGDQDAHCITVNGAVENLWVTYNTLARCSGDAMQVEAQMGNAARIHHVYYGKNEAFGHRQSGGWVKNATDVIFSQNKTHDFKSNSGGPGACYGLQYDAANVWFLFNEGYNCSIGIDVAGGDSHPGAAYIIGNYIHDIPAGSNNPYDTGGMVVRSGGQAIALNNTLRTIGSNGINVLPGQTLTVQNNVLAGISGRTLYNEGTLNADHNMYQSGATFTGTTGGSSITTGDPQFFSAADAHLKVSSPAIDRGVLASAYATFQSRYGLSILTDRDGTPRAGAALDLGAYEYAVPPPPAVAVRLYTVTPCRIVDTRNNAMGGPAMVAHEIRVFRVIGACNIPSTAKAVSATVTAVVPSHAGYASVYPTGIPLPGSSTVNFRAGQTRANSLMLLIGNGGNLNVLVEQPAGATNVLLDVNGYFQ